jgi:predicted unusual protein kinase regulating ubiquinone biosynthesis (AarF/ABC1/UbiB family)
MPQLVALASLGQVYKATLRHDNRKPNNLNNSTTIQQQQQVAIKIQQPDIFETVTLDLYLLITYGITAHESNTLSGTIHPWICLGSIHGIELH